MLNNKIFLIVGLFSLFLCAKSQCYDDSYTCYNACSKIAGDAMSFECLINYDVYCCYQASSCVASNNWNDCPCKSGLCTSVYKNSTNFMCCYTPTDCNYVDGNGLCIPDAIVKERIQLIILAVVVLAVGCIFIYRAQKEKIEKPNCYVAASTGVSILKIIC